MLFPQVLTREKSWEVETSMPEIGGVKGEKGITAVENLCDLGGMVLTGGHLIVPELKNGKFSAKETTYH